MGNILLALACLIFTLFVACISLALLQFVLDKLVYVVDKINTIIKKEKG